MKYRTVPGDQKSREAILQETEKNVFVQASAGTGKTTLMVDRVIELVRKGIQLDKLAVVTFTNPAAAELRIRIRDKLRVESSNGSRECALALKAFTSAWISTIHGFASRILKEYFNFTGVDPSFSITETHFTPVEINREWDRWLLELDSDNPGRNTEVLIETDTRLQKEIALGIEKRRWFNSIENVGGSAAAAMIFKEYLDKYESAIESVLHECNDQKDGLFVGGAAFLEGVRKLKNTLSKCDNEDVISLFSLIHTGRGSVKNWDDKERAKQILGEAREQFKKIAPVIMSGRLTEQTWEFASPFARELRSKWDSDRSRLSYNDLLYVTWKAIARSRQLARCLKERFHHILIDEFQDTSSEQTALFEAFLQQEGRLPDGCITVVADDKQSIYGWRNADIETYNDFRNRLENSGALSETITTNFRSSQNIITFVNIFGSHLFLNQSPEEETFGCHYSPIEPRPGAPEGEPVRIVTLPDMPDKMKKIYNKNAYDTLLQAEWFADYLKKGFYDGDVPEDYALLYRSGTHLHHFIDVLEREGIPYYVSSSRDFLLRAEINDLRELIKCLLYPGDSLAWVHTLRSLFFGLPDDVINMAVESGTKGYSGQSDESPRDILEVNRQLRKFRRSIMAVPLADFLFELLFQTGMIPVLAAVKYQETRRLGNLQYILEQVLSGEIRSPVELLRTLDEKLAPERTEEPSSVPAEGGAVTVTTIHGAKGLAWKRVVIASMPTASHNKSGKVISYDHRNMAAFNLGVSMDGSGRNRMKSPFWPEITGIREAREKAELRRLLYVAATRPRDSLTIFAKPMDRLNKSDGATLWQSLRSAIAEDPECCMVDEILPMEHFSTSPSGMLEIGIDNDIPASVSEVLFEIDPEPDGWQEQGAAIGDCVHAVMEKIDFSSPEEWFTENEKYLKNVYGKDYKEIKELSLNFFRMKLPFVLESSEILGREYPYFVKTAGGLKKRYIDLLLRDNGKLTVVDYKTDTFSGSTAEKVAESYIDKQRHYLRDISEIFGDKTCGYLVFLREKIVYQVLTE
jgi:ATP-dependent helicase/nuclease subunit A